MNLKIWYELFVPLNSSSVESKDFKMSITRVNNLKHKLLKQDSNFVLNAVGENDRGKLHNGESTYLCYKKKSSVAF